MRKCKACNGKGFVFDSIELPSNKTVFGFPVLEKKGIQYTCGSCYGKGMK